MTAHSHCATITWTRDGADFVDNRYSRGHAWTFDGGVAVAASASPHIVPAPMSVAAAVDPEEAFVASLASCHMLWFLSIAARRRVVVDRYLDAAEGTLDRDADGHQAMTRVLLRPEVTFAGAAPSLDDIDAMHHEAHERCFLARSVRCEVLVQPRRR